MTDLPRIAVYESLVTDKFDSVTGNNYTDDLTLYNALEESILPNTEKWLNAAKNVEISSPELRNIHVTYIDAVDMYYEAMLSFSLGASLQSSSMIDLGNEELEEGSQLMDEYTTEFEAYSKKIGAY